MTYKDFAIRSDLSPAGLADDLGLDLSRQTRLQLDSVRPRGILRSFLPGRRGLRPANVSPVFSKLKISTMITKNIAKARETPSATDWRMLSIACR